MSESAVSNTFTLGCHGPELGDTINLATTTPLIVLTSAEGHLYRLQK